MPLGCVRHWARVIHQPERVYGAIVDNSGLIVAHSNPDHEGRHLPENWSRKPLPGAGPNVVETYCDELTPDVPAYDIAAPISVGGTRVGTYHSGVNAPWVQEQLATALGRVASLAVGDRRNRRRGLGRGDGATGDHAGAPRRWSTSSTTLSYSASARSTD